jgi:acyl transferase domain-containing protein/acyl carrier protein
MEEQNSLGGSLGIAIIGMAARFPGANDIAEFWENLRAGRESIRRLSDEELSAAGVPQATLDHPGYVKAAATLEEIDLFDAAFFDCSPREATFIDPQQRLLLEYAWRALDDAGYSGGCGSDAVGVYAGIKMNTYIADFFANAELFAPEDHVQIMMGNGDFSLSTRISYKLDLKGPSYMLQTACSTSLAAVHLACQALLLDECRMALAGAAAVDIPHIAGYYYQEGGPASPDGHCRPFDAQAQGTVFGSGIGMVVLKRLDDALADGDRIYAVIRGTAVNNDGAVKASFTAPSVEGQTRVILEALACADVSADTISYVEAHGTATPLGDPIEIMALNNAFRASTPRVGFCRIGSVKGNVGHLDAAAGLAGLIKTVLALQHRQLPPSLHYTRPNPEIDFSRSPFVVNTTLAPWEGVSLPRRAGVSSFGFGGTNTHVILEEAPPREPSGGSRPAQLLMLSAKSETALEQATADLAAHLRLHPQIDLADAAFTLQAGRPPFIYRRALVCRDAAEAAGLLEQPGDPRVLTAVLETGDRPVAFLFSGQGAQHVGMGRGLYAHEPVFREWIDRCAGLLAPQLGLDLREVLYPSTTNDQRPTTNDQRPTTDKKTRRQGEGEAVTQHSTLNTQNSSSLLDQTQYTQPALFVIEYSLAQLWMAWGLKPQAMIGHSIGEYVAACLAGVFSLEDALMLVAARGRLMQAMPPGAMLSVALPEAELRGQLGLDLALAAINAPGRCVVAGPAGAIMELEQRLAAAEVSCRRLHTSHAFHSPMMEPILEPFLDRVRRIALRPPALPYISNLTGDWVRVEEAADPRYWARHLRQPVRFAEGLARLRDDEGLVLLEVGPGQTLATLARQSQGGIGQPVLSSLPAPTDPQPDEAFVLNSLGGLWLAGVEIDWAGFYAGQRRQRVTLPAYPFERRRYWFEPPQSARRSSAGAAQAQQHTARRPQIADWFYAPSWKRSLAPTGGLEDSASRQWLLFLDERGLGAQLIDRLAQAGHQVTTVRGGPRFARLNEGVYALNPTRPKEYDALLDDLRAARRWPDTIVHLWSVTGDEPELAPLDRLDRALERGFYSLLYLAQSLGKQDGAEALQLVAVSNELHDVTGADPVAPEKATLLGPLKVIPLEYPHVRCRSVDVLLPPAALPQPLIDRLLADLLIPSAAQVLAYRGPHCWEQIVEPARLEQPARPALRERGTYLITGGLGGMGLALAQHLAETARANLILTARTAPPERDAWEGWLAAHDEHDPVSERIRAVQALERAGAEVLAVSADVIDLEQMRAVVSQALGRFGAIDGVIHAAGVAGGGIIQLKTVELASAVLGPKVRGALVLNEVLKEARPDFMVLCSSLSALVGEFGQVDYCAANAFLDALAYRRQAAPARRTLTIDWDMWREVGMTVRTSVPAMLQGWREEQLQQAMLTAEGVDVFSRALAQQAAPQLLVCTIDIGARVEQFRALTRSRILGAVEQLPAPAPGELGLKHPRPNLRTSYQEPRNQVEQTLAAIWQETLGLERVGVQDNFFELGGDSLIGLKLIAHLKQIFGIEIPAVDLYKGPTISRLAAIISPASDQTAPDEAARQAGLSRGAARREHRRQQKREADPAGGPV